MPAASAQESGGSREVGIVSERLLTTRQVAELLAVSPATVLRRWRAGELPGYRLATNCLRFDAAEIDAWLEAHRYDGRTSVRP